MEDKEKLYISHKGTIERKRNAYIGPGDFKAAGFPQEEWPRLVKELEFDETLFKDYFTFSEVDKEMDQTKSKELINKYLMREDLFKFITEEELR